MWRSLAIDGTAFAIVVGVWYCLFAHLNRKRGVIVLNWITAAFSGHGHVAGVQWITASRFQVKLRLADGAFQHPVIVVQLARREFPGLWFLNHFRRRQETLTFEANLHCAPNCNLDIKTHRWVGRTRRKLAKSVWHTERLGPFVISSRNDWQRDVTNLMHGAGAARACGFLNVAFRRSSPHFSAMVPLESVSPKYQEAISIFDTLKELAAGASASRM